MIFDSVFGLPRDTGATDYADSARLAGIMVLVDHPKAPLMIHYINEQMLVVRHPGESPANNPLNCTRDQELLIAAGLNKQNELIKTNRLYEDAEQRSWYAQNIESDVPGSLKKWPDGADWLSPSHRLHLALSAGKPGSFIGYSWLVFDIMFNAVFTPTRESNQLLAQLLIAGPKFVKFYKLITPFWRKAIRDYWSGWRNEADLAELIIKKIEST